MHDVYYGGGKEHHEDFLEALIRRVPLGRVHQAQVAVVGVLGCPTLRRVEERAHLEVLYRAVLSEESEGEEREVLQSRVGIP